jgi:hypothetical protein
MAQACLRVGWSAGGARVEPASARRPPRGRLCLFASLVAAAAFVSLWVVAHPPVGRIGAGSPVRVAARAHAPSRGLAALPLAARGAVSRALGRDDRSYDARALTGGLVLRNAGQDLVARLDRSGVAVQSGRARLGLSLVGYGYGDALRPVAVVSPRAHANRVVYARGGLSEWYSNGPLGLEQGFTVARPPMPEANGELTLALRVSGNLRGTLAHGTVTFTGLDGVSLAYRDLVASDATGRRLPARIDLVGGRVLIRVDASGARYPLRIDPFVQQAKLTATDAATGAMLGAVAVSGNTIVAGAPTTSINGNIDQGAVDVFAKSPGGWANATQTAELTASDGASGDDLGGSVAISGNTIVAGAPQGDLGGTGPGAAYVFVEPAGGWVNATQTAKLTASDGVVADYFGISVAISGNTIVVGAPSATVGVNSFQGAAYVFVKPAGGWVNAAQTAKLTASDGAAGDGFGSVAVAGNTIVVGAPGAAPGESEGGTVSPGAAYAFVEPAGGWGNATQTAKLTASDGVAGDGLGSSVAVSGNTIVAGAPNVTIGGNTSQGVVYVFLEHARGWANTTQSAKLTAYDGATNDHLGESVALSGNTIIAGAPRGTDLHGDPVQGAAYVFVEHAGGWAGATQTAELTGSDGAAGENLGGSVAISGNTIVAAVGNSSDGEADVFVEPGGGWTNKTQSAKLTASGGGPGGGLGGSVAISGNTIVVGAPNATVGGNTYQGAVYVFVKPPSGWANATQTAKLTSSDGGASYWEGGGGPYGDYFGGSVAIAGNTIVVGAGDATVGDNLTRGAVYVFVEPPGGWVNATQTAKLTASDGATNDDLGESVAVSGNTIVAGAGGAKVGGSPFQGAVYVFIKSPGGWVNATQTAKLTASDGAADDGLGSVAVSGNTIVAGAYNATVGGNPSQGAVYVFIKPPGGWVNATQTAKLTASDGAADDGLGASVAVSVAGSTIVAGPAATINGYSPQGAVYVFAEPLGGWANATQTAKLTASDGAAGDGRDGLGDGLGYSVAVSGDTIVAGAPNAVVGGNFEGAAYVFASPPPPLIAGIWPAWGPTAGGTRVTITGSGFTGATRVAFGALAATRFTVVSDTKIIAVSPAQTGVHYITVTAPGGTSATAAAAVYTYIRQR